MWRACALAVLLANLLVLPLSGTEHSPTMTEKSLIQDLLRDYDKKSRPVVDGDPPNGTHKVDRRKEKGANSSTIPIQQITVEFGLKLVRILNLDEMDQVLTTSMISLYKWTDYHLRWEPHEENNITFVHIPTNMIWLPDIALYNYADERLEERRDCAAKVHFNGTVEWRPMAIYKSACEIKIKYFPFDKQACWLKFGPWTYDGWRVNISYYNGMAAFEVETEEDHDGFDRKSPEWKILNHTAKYSEVVYPCCPEPYVDITFWIWMQRSTAFHTLILILPCFLLSSLTLVIFWLPPETPAKMVLGMNIFVAFFLLMLLLESQTPSASDSFPLIGQYYCLNMGIITLSTFLSVIVVNFHFRGDNRQEVPHWLKKLAIQHGAQLLFVNLGTGKPLPKAAAAADAKQASSTRRTQGESLPLRRTVTSSAFAGGGGIATPGIPNANAVSQANHRVFDEIQARRTQLQHQHQRYTMRQPIMDAGTRRRINMLTKDVQDIVKALRYIQRLHETKEKMNKIVQEWRSVALVMDRLFFVIYLATIILSIIFFFPKSGNEVEPGVIPSV